MQRYVAGIALGLPLQLRQLQDLLWGAETAGDAIELAGQIQSAHDVVLVQRIAFRLERLGGAP